MSYTSMQQQYIDSVGGEAHQSALDIIGRLESALRDLVDRDFTYVGAYAEISYADIKAARQLAGIEYADTHGAEK